MDKKLILVAAPPACGKTYVSERIAQSIQHIVYLDKDDLTELVRTSFAVAGNALDMDGAFYIENIRAAEYATLLHIALSTLRFEQYVLVNAPFGKEVRNVEFIKELKNKVNGLGAQLVLLWVTAPLDLCYQRMKKRNSDRDTLKLQNWDAYVKKINYEPPYALVQESAVDRFMVIDTKNEQSLNASMESALNMIQKE